MLAKGLIMVILGTLMPTDCILRSIRFDQECAGYLKQAADANTAELAINRLGKAIEYVEAHGLTDGYTSVLWRTEDENIGYWYENLKACQQELTECLDGTQLEKTNVLMKVRESLCDNGEKGTKLTIPAGISKYPNNTLFALLNLISVIVLFFGLGLIYAWFDDEL